MILIKNKNSRVSINLQGNLHFLMPDNLNPFSSFNYFEKLFNNTTENNVLLMNEKGFITNINPAFTKNFGYEPKDIIGQNTAILFTEEDQQKGILQKELQNVLSTGQSDDNNYLVSKDKTLTWVSGESVLIKNDEGGTNILKIIQNIHRQKTSERFLQQLNEFNENILGSIEDVVIVLNEQMEVVKVNQAFTAIFKYDEQQKKILNFANLIKPFDITGALLNDVQNAIRNKKEFSNNQVETEIRSGERRMFDISCKPMYDREDKNIVVVMHDITVHKQAEREREDLIGFVAHELRNALANLVLCNELLGDAIKENKQDDVIEMLGRSRNNIQRLNKMIAELYEAAKANSGYLKLDISTFNFSEMIKEAIDTLQVLQPAYNIVVQGDADIDVSGDRFRLIQVITNYLSNGIKYSNDTNSVKLTVIKQDDTLTVSVKDEGLGISKKQLPYIFERFFRAEKTKNLEGLGLGLYLCRQIIHAHQGQVWAESEEQKGSTFYFTIPVKYATPLTKMA